MKYVYPAALAAAFLIVGGTWLLGTSAAATTALTAPPVEQTVAAPTTAVATSTSAVAPAPDTYTLAQVAMHSSASDCWTTINGSVYDLTPFIPQHPGGEQIVAICGIDGTSAFEAQHGNNRQANRELATLKIGTLIQ